MPKAILNHLKIFALNRIIVPIKNQSKLVRNIGSSARSLGDFPIKQIFHVGFFWLKALSCKSLLKSIVLTQLSHPNGWRVLAYSSHLHLPNSADFSLICMTRGDKAKGATLRQEFAGKNDSCAYIWTLLENCPDSQSQPALAWKAHSHVSIKLWKTLINPPERQIFLMQPHSHPNVSKWLPDRSWLLPQ